MVKVVLLLLTFLTNIAYGEIIDYIAAVVNDEPVLYSEVVEFARESGITDLRLARDKLIEKKILLLEAKKEGIEISSQELERAFKGFLEETGIKDLKGINADLLKQRLKEQLIITKLIARKVKSKIRVSDPEVEKYCRSVEKKVRDVYYIKLKDKSKLKLVLENLKTKPFEEVAKKFSEEKTFHLGLVERGSLFKELDDAVWNAKIGVPKVVETKKGIFVVFVKSERVKTCNREEVRKKLFSEKLDKALKDYIEKLKQKASVKVYL
jgi:parvulin-like peptidyl-prolyl isomerase